MSSPIESEIRSRVEDFAAKLISLVQATAVELVEGALGGSARGRGRRGRPPGRLAQASPVSRAKGAKRDPQVLAQLTEKLGAFIAKNPGKRIEEIGQALGTATRHLALPVKKLIRAKTVSTKGQKRATTYYPGGGRPSKPAGSVRGSGATAKKPGRKSAPKKAARKTTAKAAQPVNPKAQKPTAPKPVAVAAE